MGNLVPNVIFHEQQRLAIKEAGPRKVKNADSDYFDQKKLNLNFEKAATEELKNVYNRHFEPTVSAVASALSGKKVDTSFDTVEKDLEKLKSRVDDPEAPELHNNGKSIVDRESVEYMNECFDYERTRKDTIADGVNDLEDKFNYYQQGTKLETEKKEYYLKELDKRYNNDFKKSMQDFQPRFSAGA